MNVSSRLMCLNILIIYHILVPLLISIKSTNKLDIIPEYVSRFENNIWLEQVNPNIITEGSTVIVKIHALPPTSTLLYIYWLRKDILNTSVFKFLMLEKKTWSSSSSSSTATTKTPTKTRNNNKTLVHSGVMGRWLMQISNWKIFFCYCLKAWNEWSREMVQWLGLLVALV